MAHDSTPKRKAGRHFRLCRSVRHPVPHCIVSDCLPYRNVPAPAFTDFGIESLIDPIKTHKDDPTIIERWNARK
jgi:hypothetical protein